MNICGFENNITQKFTDEDPFELEKEYWFSEWYDIVAKIAFIPKSYILSYKDLFNGVIDNIICTLPNKQCFARLDTLSSKPTAPYKNSNQIIDDLKMSSRTKDYFTESMPVIIREYLDLTGFEFRCFVHGKKLRAISSEGNLTNTNIEEIKVLVDKITFYTDYDSYCIDLTYYQDKLMVIEINTPVWLFATSGLFCLDEPCDLSILLGQYNPDILTYPIVRVCVHN